MNVLPFYEKSATLTEAVAIHSSLGPSADHKVEVPAAVTRVLEASRISSVVAMASSPDAVKELF